MHLSARIVVCQTCMRHCGYQGVGMGALCSLTVHARNRVKCIETNKAACSDLGNRLVRWRGVSAGCVCKHCGGGC